MVSNRLCVLILVDVFNKRLYNILVLLIKEQVSGTKLNFLEAKAFYSLLLMSTGFYVAPHMDCSSCLSC
jgi:hypothetical protein